MSKEQPFQENSIEVNPQKTRFISAETGAFFKQKGLTIIIDRDAKLFWGKSTTQLINELRSFGVDPNVLNLVTSETGDFSLTDETNNSQTFDQQLNSPSPNFLFITPCTSTEWSNGKIHQQLLSIVDKKNFALVNPFPDHNWRSTALGRGTEGYLSSSTAQEIESNTQLTFEKQSPFFSKLEQADTSPRLVLPVLGLEQESIDSYIEVLKGNTENYLAAYRFRMSKFEADSHESQTRQIQPKLSGEDSVRRFRSSAHPVATKLATLLAVAAPIDFEVVEKVQQEMLPDLKNLETYFAYIFFGGLLEETNIGFEFQEGVRKELLSGGRRSEYMQIFRLCGSILSERFPEKGEMFYLLTCAPPEFVTRQIDQIVVDDGSVDFVRNFSSFGRYIYQRSQYSDEMYQKLDSLVAEYDAQKESEKPAKTTEVRKSENGPESLKRIALIEPFDFKRYEDLKKLDNFPDALREVSLFLVNNPREGISVKNGETKDMIGLSLGTFPTIDISWTVQNLNYKIRLDYLNEEGRTQQITPARIDVSIIDPSNPKPIFDYELYYDHFPLKTLQPGSFTCNFLPSNEFAYVHTHWGHTDIGGLRKNDPLNPQDLTQCIARMTKFAATAVLGSLKSAESSTPNETAMVPYNG